MVQFNDGIRNIIRLIHKKGKEILNVKKWKRENSR
jgi:hypothetical protein